MKSKKTASNLLDAFFIITDKASCEVADNVTAIRETLHSSQANLFEAWRCSDFDMLAVGRVFERNAQGGQTLDGLPMFFYNSIAAFQEHIEQYHAGLARNPKRQATAYNVVISDPKKLTQVRQALRANGGGQS